MADFSKFKVGSTSYNVKDAAAGKSLSISGSSLSLKNAAGTAISTVTLPGGGGAYVILVGAYNSMFNSFIVSNVLSDAGHTITTFQNMCDAIATDGAAVYLVDNTDPIAEITPLTYIHESTLGPNTIEVGFIGVTKGWYTTQTISDPILGTPWTAYTPASGGSAGVSFIGTCSSNQWPNYNNIAYAAGTFKLSNQVALSISDMTGFTAIYALAARFNDYMSVEDYLSHNPTAGSTFTIIAWFMADANTKIKVTATCTYGGNGEYTVYSVNATSANIIGQ